MFCNLICHEHIFTLRLRECNKVSRAGQRTSTFFDFSHDCGLVAREKNEMIVQTLRRCFTDANRKAKRISVLAPCKGIRIPESTNFLLVESGILGFGIRNPALRICNPTKDWNPESNLLKIHSTLN